MSSVNLSPVMPMCVKKSSNLFRSVRLNEHCSKLQVAGDILPLFEFELTKSHLLRWLHLRNSSFQLQSLVVAHLGFVEWFLTAKSACRHLVQCCWLQPCMRAILYYFYRAYCERFLWCFTFCHAVITGATHVLLVLLHFLFLLLLLMRDIYDSGRHKVAWFIVNAQKHKVLNVSCLIHVLK